MVTTKSLWLGRSFIEAEVKTRTIREATSEEPADVQVVSETLLCNGRPANVSKYRKLWRHVLDYGR